MTPRQCVELFHLVFVRALTARLDDKKLVCVKGGCNLRFFFESVRYSEDIDLDVAVVARETLQKKVDGLLQSPIVVAPLKAMGVSVVEVSKPKQTETTQRWKAGLRTQGQRETIRTKIEFSRRAAIAGAAFEAVHASVTSRYMLPPFLVTHYPASQAIIQKIHALCERHEPQPRDVFDLNLLFARRDVTVRLSEEEKAWVPGAIDNAISISYDDYSAKVVDYLEPDHAELYASRVAWELMQSVVTDRVGRLGK